MENVKTYAFTSENRSGKAWPAVRTPLLEGLTPQGDAVVLLCQADSFIPLDKGPALVYRSDGKAAWEWVASLERLRSLLGEIPVEQLGTRLGVWIDRPKWGLFGSADGKIQEKEVETLEARWHSLRQDELVQFEDKGYRSGDPDQPPQRCILGWWHAEAEVNAAQIRLLEASFPDKTVAVLEEPRRIVRHEIARALRLEFDKSKSALIPCVLEHQVHELSGSHNQGKLKREECLARAHKEGNPSYVLPLV